MKIPSFSQLFPSFDPTQFMQVGKKVDPVMQTVPIAFSGLVLFGHTFEDWILLGTGILLAFNLVFVILKLYDRFK